MVENTNHLSSSLRWVSQKALKSKGTTKSTNKSFSFVSFVSFVVQGF